MERAVLKRLGAALSSFRSYMEPAQVKVCSKCKSELPISSFSLNRCTKDGFQKQCKECVKVNSSVYYLNNKDKVKIRNKKWTSNHHAQTIMINKRWKENNPEKSKKIKLQNIKRNKENPEFVDTPQLWYFNRVALGAKIRKIKFNLTLKDFISTFNGVCALSGVVLKCTRTHAQSPGNQNASLDRIDSSKGYEVGNIQWVDIKINVIKNTYSQEDFITMCTMVVNHNKKS